MKTFTQKENIALQEYLSTIIGNPTPFAKQTSVFDTSGKCIWCEEWELIEMLKYLFNGKDIYYRDPPPNRLKDSTLWSKEKIEEKAEAELGKIEDINLILAYFKKWREGFNESMRPV
jgi:hypothetical protein